MVRRATTVRGIVQGVGFRPFVHGLATRLDVYGFVKNMSGTLHITHIFEISAGTGNGLTDCVQFISGHRRQGAPSTAQAHS